jgi:fusaric acid resistance family protein
VGRCSILNVNSRKPTKVAVNPVQNDPLPDADDPVHAPSPVRAALGGAIGWLDRIDPGTHRRIKGLRLVTAYGIAAMLGMMVDIRRGLPNGAGLSSLAGGFALWASVSEGRGTRSGSTRDLLLFSAAAALGAASYIVLAPLLQCLGHTGPELTLAGGAFLVGYLRRFGVTGTGLGSQLYIGQLLAYGAHLSIADLPTVAVAGLLAALASIVPRLLSGPGEHPLPVPAPVTDPAGAFRPELIMGLQAAIAAVVIVVLNAAVGLTQSAWAITACTYVVTGSVSTTIDRVKRRIIGTAIGVSFGLVCLPLVTAVPLVVWAAAALAMVVYAMALPERYDIACGAYAFTLIVTLAETGEHSMPLLASRAWETLLGGTLGLAAGMLLLPLRTSQKS